MRNYELMFIAHPDLDESALNDLIQKVSSWIQENNGQIERVEQWGKRKLAYPIRKQSEGHYVLMNLALPPVFVPQLERNLRYLEQVMRFLITLQ
ncbi:MAG: 30S ribosomal protein S6 [Anaerolineales bacterium]|nr:30S ribosomal protein S6 [Anaerolineales bacterium]MCS7247198.1 30S ribosomal protein S6 [Anaerolineales bacterium]MDW8161009.1 30S ribosomal protein S6 [Anaerolineales bacterium]MDW8447142.1 30S ribosomal protein S6 [Anaerolineales bacterium]